MMSGVGKMAGVVLLLTIASEWIGVRRFDVGPGMVLFLPLLYGFVFGALLNPNLTRVGRWLFSREEAHAAQALIVVAIMPFVARFGTLIGPTADELVAAGPALVLQELGNFGTVLIALPVAVVGLGMGREAVGATFSIAREPNIAIISDRYGLSSAEGTGVMSVYVLGTLFGTLVFTVMASLLGSTGWLRPEAMAMACGVGSGSMMVACAGALAEVFPQLQDELLAYAGASNLLTYATGLYVSLFLALPAANFLYRILRGERPEVKTFASTPDETTRPAIDLVRTTRALALVCGLVWIGNLVSGPPARASFEAVVILLAIAFVGLGLTKWAPFYLPSVAWISLVGILVTLPLFPWSAVIEARMATVSVIAVATPCLVFAGLAVSESEIKTFRASGFRLTIVAVLVFIGTYAGSATVAHIVLNML